MRGVGGMRRRGRLWRRIGTASVLLPCLAWAGPALAVHYDVALRLSQGPVAGSRIETDLHGDLALPDGLPIDAATGQQIYPGYFSDLEGGPYVTDDPGFQAFKGTFIQGEIVHYRALGRLEYWNPQTGRWGLAPAGVQLALFGGIPSDVALGHAHDPATWEEAYQFHAAGTRFHRDGVSGPVTAFIDDARRDGAFHAHLDWKISAEQGVPAAGAYLVTLQLWSSAVAGGVPKYQPARPIKVLFERGISQAQWLLALRGRVQPPGELGGADPTPAIPRPAWALPARQP